MRAVVRVIDAETVLLDDDQRGAPHRGLGAALARHEPRRTSLGRPSKPRPRRLRDLVLGRSVELAYSGRRIDRYGRLLAHLFLDRDGERVWVQGELLSSGHARAYGLPGNFACMRELLGARARRARGQGRPVVERRLRRARRHRARGRSSAPAQHLPDRRRAAIAHVAATKSRTYLNFGSDWRTDFTAGISASVLRAQSRVGKDAGSARRASVEVRGWIEYRNGPYIDVEDPSQIARRRRGPASAAPRAGAPTVSSDRAQSACRKSKTPGSKNPGAVDL